MAFEVGSPTVNGSGWDLGCDPEIFVARQTKAKTWQTIGSERILGLKSKTGLVATDGVQIELHPEATTCRANVSNYIQTAFKDLKFKMDLYPDKLKVDFSAVVKVSKAELMKLSEESRALGCLPSFNAYGRPWKMPKGMPLTRSAAGHIHFGSKKAIKEPDSYAKLLDLLVGIPCVLLDRSPDAAKRRRLYGKAGEYRLPKHGFEYRTLSNFWLRNYAVFSLVFGLAKTASAIESTHLSKNLYENDAYYKQYKYNTTLRNRLLEAADFKKVEKAINTNDFDLAEEIFDEFCRPVYSTINYGAGLTPSNIMYWDYFVEKGLDHFFPNDDQAILDHWLSKPEGHGHGWESWVYSTLQYMARKQAVPPPPVPEEEEDVADDGEDYYYDDDPNRYDDDYDDNGY